MQTLTFTVQNGNVIGSQSSFRFDSDEERGSSSGSYAFTDKVFALEAQSEGPFLHIIFK